MTIVIYRRRVAAAVDRDEVRLAPHVEVLECDHPDRRFVCAMCLYAHDVLCGLIPGDYDQGCAERYARTFLTPDWAFTDLTLTDVDVAELYAVPLDQVAAGRREWVDLDC